ncbi:MAG: filamentous hemagglutinin N-terminal domain-containing protein [Nostoc sp. EfeVER01]|uniref:two-partner secretion domain-containing protein n=1 Tax=unclassified Nostoc TaxID=2593658 RepID=UPI002AD243AD|nr:MULTISPECIES: filamentous hemagglutinin N-terminal domain-containing protein [unclassified Nostoc]MDZ7947094.1 filamentous hemagglutinin N-terminal domain-containing protein [Nostoc sp. EfeVER01]MDZ7991519.1 filamentous hemagglutinin N-terminal domain-containing protein [Nostoc sp. EspVER01]
MPSLREASLSERLTRTPTASNAYAKAMTQLKIPITTITMQTNLDSTTAVCVGMGIAIAFWANCSSAQITPDSTLLNNSRVTLQDNIRIIEGGTQAGSNLFHSFEEFSVPTKSVAYFNNASNIQNIISRVTGKSVSNIDGLISANGTANLFLMNPNGIIFGPNASLNIGGSFVATTANAIGFGNQGFFSASNPNIPSLLTVKPSALLFNQIVAAPIQNNSIAPAANPSVFGLSVPNGRSLLLVGGNIQINGAGLYAFGGRVELGGLARAGTIGLQVDGNNLSLSFPEQATRADVSLTGGGVAVPADKEGSIIVNARNIEILEGSALISGINAGLGEVDNKAGDITLNATGTVTVAGGSLIQNLVQTGATGNSGNIRITAESLAIADEAALIVALNNRGRGNLGNVVINVRDQVSLNGGAVFSSVSKGGVGKAGNITVTTGLLSLTNGGVLNVSNYGQGDAGSVSIQARGSVFADGVGRSGSLLSGSPSGVGSLIGPGVIGQAGDITIVAESLSLTNGAELAASISGQGRAGNVMIQTRDPVLIEGVGSNNFSSGVFSTVNPGGVGQGGNVTVIAESLSLTNGGELATSIFGQGRGGNVTIQTRGSVFIKGVGSNELPSGAFSTLVQGSGQGGNVTVIAESLFLTNGGGVSANTQGQGNAGNVTIQVSGLISFDRFGSAITNGVGPSAVGDGGNINISTGLLSLTRGAQINTSTSGRGNAGNLTIQASKAVFLDGVDSINNSASFIASSVDATGIGKGGKLDITTARLSVTNGAVITAETEGNGDAGSLTVTADKLEVVNRGQLRTSTSSDSQAGDISLRVQDHLILIGKDSGLFANTEPSSTGNGGNIFIQPRNITASKTVTIQDDARIAVNSQGSGKGGNIQIQAESLTLDNQGLISAQTASNKGGNINLSLQDLLLLRRNSQISSTAGTAQAGGDGGNVTIKTPFIIAVPSEDSNISANAFTGKGGNVDITVKSLFGIESRSRPTSLSDITASSERGVAGTVELNTPDVDPSRGLIQLPSNLVDASQQMAQGCTPRRGQTVSRFIATGRGGLPLSPNEPLRGRAVITNWVDLPPQATERVTDKLSVEITDKKSTTFVTKSTNQIVEAQSWVVDPNGDIQLVAQAPNVSLYSPWQTNISCTTSKY